jgi:hypothetical protein
MARHNEWYASTVREIAELADGDLVVEIASNDGSLLLNFDQSRFRRLGIEPARNIAEIARERGLDTIEEFFDERLAETVRGKHGPARAIMANNVLAHVDDTRAFLSGCRTLLAADGLLTIEVPYLGHMIEHVEYDTIYHEHLCYFALSPLLRVFDELDLSVTRVDHVPVHGGSLRIYARPAAFAGAHGAGTLRLAARERQQGLTDEVRLRRFAAAVAKNRRRLLDLIDGIHGDGDSIVAYGAPAKGNTLLNYCGIGPDRIAYTVDMNPLKIGKFTPGAHIPVRPVADLEVHPPDYLLILAWNFAEEIMGQQRFLRDRGTRFVLPIPEPRIL